MLLILLWFWTRDQKVKEEREYELEHTRDEQERKKKMKEWEDEEGKKVIIKYYQTGSFWGNLDTCSTHIAQKFPSHENLLRQGSRNFVNITFTENGGFVNVAMAVYDCLQNMVPPTWLGAPSRARWLNVRLGQLSNIFQKPPLLHLQNLRFQWKNFQWTWSYIFAIQNSSVKVGGFPKNNDQWSKKVI